MNELKLEIGDRLYLRRCSLELVNIENFKPLEWFQLSLRKADDVFSPFIATFVLQRELRLLNLGNGINRDLAATHTNLTYEDLHPVNQYSSHECNWKVHEEIFKSKCFKKYNGTVVTHSLVSPFLMEELENVEEVVLYKERIIDALSLVSLKRNEVRSKLASTFVMEELSTDAL